MNTQVGQGVAPKVAAPKAAAPAAEAPKAVRPSDHVSIETQRSEDRRGTEHVNPRVRQRLRKGLVQQDEFFLPVEEIPEGLTYEWKRFSVKGEEDPFYLAQLREQGFDPVPPSRHPNWVPPGYNAPYIVKGGMILMDRPIELTAEARAESQVAANKQIKEAEQRLGKTPAGEMTRDDPRVAPKVIKEIGRMVPMAIEE
jgi:hypothetical protein